MSPLTTTLPGDDRPSGEFYARKVWSCPEHDDPQTHCCDCDQCTLPYYTCDGCASATWVDGPLTELTVGEARNRDLIQGMVEDIGVVATFAEMIKADTTTRAQWLDDEAMPRIK